MMVNGSNETSAPYPYQLYAQPMLRITVIKDKIVLCSDIYVSFNTNRKLYRKPKAFTPAVRTI